MKYRVEPIFDFNNELKRRPKYFVDFHLGVTLQSIGYRQGYKDFCLFIYLGFWWVELGFKLIPKRAEHLEETEQRP